MALRSFTGADGSAEANILNRVVHRKLQPVSLGLGALYLAITVAHGWVLEGRERVWLMTAAGGSAAMFLGMAWYLRRRPVAEWLAEPLAAGICAATLANSLLHLFLAEDVRQTTNVTLVIVGAGALLMSLEWWAMVVVMAVGGWAVCMALAGAQPPDWVHYGFAMVFATFLSGFMSRLRRLASLEAESRFRELADSIPEVFWVARPGLERFLYVSSAYEKVWGQSAQVVLKDGQRHLDPIHPEDLPMVRAAVARQAAGEETEVEFRLGDGEAGLRWLHDRAYPVRNARGAVIRVNGLTREVTEARRVADERRELERRLLENQKLESLGVLAGGVAHDFNNLLMVILGNANLARTECAPDSSLDRGLAQIEGAVKRASDLCRQMLACAGHGRRECQPLALGGLVADMEDLLRVTISRRADLRMSVEPDLPLIEADPTQLRQVIVNLAVNASEALENQPGRLEVRVFRQSAGPGFFREAQAGADLPAGEYVGLSVADDGPGIEDRAQGRVFEPFFTTKFAGRGLGLAVVHGIVRGHGGAIRLWSRPGEGTVVTTYFPARDAGRVGPSGAAGTVDSGVAEAGTGWRVGGTILVVDDEEEVRSTLTASLGRIGFRAEEAADGQDLLEILTTRSDCPYRAILLDLSMPRVSGPRALAEVGRRWPEVPVILMSGFGASEVAGVLGEARPAAFLQKPFNSQVLKATLQSVLVEGAIPGERK